jgi:tRNA(Ile)-lysidine synthase
VRADKCATGWRQERQGTEGDGEGQRTARVALAGHPAPAVAAIRNAVRESIRGLPPGALVLVACSGGADSLALAAALAFAGPRAGIRAGGVTVDHGLQDGSAARAADVAARLADLGLDPVHSVSVAVGQAGGPEAAARSARYEALREVSEQAGAAAVLLGHTLDDQAETVLLGLARGSGSRSLAGMAARRGIYRRPLLDIRRSQTSAACAALGLAPWHDPHNDDRRFARVRVRLDALPALEAALGPGVAQALARTAGQLRADAEALEACLPQRPVPSVPLLTNDLSGLPEAIRTRVLRSAAIEAGCPPGALSARHVRRLDELVTSWHGQRWVDLPGKVRAERREGELLFSVTGGVPDGRQ